MIYYSLHHCGPRVIVMVNCSLFNSPIVSGYCGLKTEKMKLHQQVTTLLYYPIWYDERTICALTLIGRGSWMLLESGGGLKQPPDPFFHGEIAI